MSSYWFSSVETLELHSQKWSIKSFPWQISSNIKMSEKWDCYTIKIILWVLTGSRDLMTMARYCSMTRNHLVRLFGGLAKINSKIDSLFMLIVIEGPKFDHSCLYNDNLFLCKKCGFSHLKKKFMSCLMYTNIAVKGLHLRISHIIHIYYMNYILLHEMKVQCTGRLDFIFNGIG